MLCTHIPSTWLKGVAEMQALDTQLDSENLTPSGYANQLT